MLQIIDNYFSKNFPWFAEHPGIWFLVLGLYALMSSTIKTENARKALAFDQNIPIAELNRVEYKFVSFIWPAVAAIALVARLLHENIPFSGVAFISISTFVVLAFALYPLAEWGERNSKAMPIWLGMMLAVVATAFVFNILQLRGFDDWHKLIVLAFWTTILLALPVVSLILLAIYLSKLYTTHREKLMIVSYIITAGFLFTYLYGLAGFYWDMISQN